MNNISLILLKAAKEGNNSLIISLPLEKIKIGILNKALSIALKNDHLSTAKLLFKIGASVDDLLETLIEEGNSDIDKYLKYCDKSCRENIFIIAAEYGNVNVLMKLAPMLTDDIINRAFLSAIKLDQLSSITYLFFLITSKSIIMEGLIEAIDRDYLDIVKYLINKKPSLLDDALVYSAFKDRTNIFINLYEKNKITNKLYNEILEQAGKVVKNYLLNGKFA